MRYWWERRREKIITGIVWRLPRQIVYWCVVRAAVMVEPENNPSDVTAVQMLKTVGR